MTSRSGIFSINKDFNISAINKLLPAALIGAVAGIDNITAALAIGALLFSGPLSSGMGLGVGVILVGGVLLAIFVSLRSVVPNSVAQVQETTIAVLGASILAMVLQSNADTQTNVATAVAIMGASSLVTGATFWLAGRFSLGGLVRFIPYPVVAGFLAGSGWLLVEGAASMLSGQQIGPAFLLALQEPDIMWRVLPAIGLAATAFWALLRYSNPAVLPILMMVAAAGFYVVLWWTGLTSEAARSLGHLPELTESESIDLPTLDLLTQVDWGAVANAGPAMLVIAGLSMVGLLLNVSGLELAMGRDIDVNAELRSSGIANLLSGAVGGPSGYVGLSMTVLADRTGVTGRSAGIATALVTMLGAIFAGKLIFQVPLFLTGGFVLFLGIGLLKEWIVDTRLRMPFSEWLIVVVILFTVALVGFTEGLAAGLLVSSAVFMYKYSRLPVVRFRGTGSELRSKVDRSPADTKHLTEHGGVIEVIRLQGYLFFGSADRIVDLVRLRLGDRTKVPLNFVLLDFENVSGADSAAITCFVKIRKLIEPDAVVAIFTNLDTELRTNLELAGIAFDSDPLMRVEDDLDHALEKTEEFILRANADACSDQDLVAQFTSVLGPHPRIGALIGQMTKTHMAPEARLIQQGAQSADVYFVGSGRVRVEVELPNGKSIRVRSMLAGAIVGEMALYLDQARTANVIIDAPSDIYALSRADLARLEKEDPELAVLFHRLMAANLAEKLIVANKALHLQQL